jgi:hypothetical protein
MASPGCLVAVNVQFCSSTCEEQIPTLNSLAKIVAKPIPRMITPKAHAQIDYVSVGLFLGTAAWVWRRNRHAALASLICGGAELAVMLFTDYPGGVKKFISFRTHREMDYGLAAIVASMPESLAFKGDDETKFFRVQGALITLLGELTLSSPSVASKRVRARAA